MMGRAPTPDCLSFSITFAKTCLSAVMSAESLDTTSVRGVSIQVKAPHLPCAQENFLVDTRFDCEPLSKHLKQYKSDVHGQQDSSCKRLEF